MAFLIAWVVGGARRHPYSPVSDAISRLAASGSSTRPLMTAGFVVFGLAVPGYALALRTAVPGAAWATAAATGVATLGVAAFPLDVSPTLDALHGAWAVLGYVMLAATPLLAAAPYARAGYRRAAMAALVVGVASGALLGASLLGPAHGLLQRGGLTVGHAWLAVTALRLLYRRPDGLGRGNASVPPDGVEPAWSGRDAG